MGNSCISIKNKEDRYTVIVVFTGDTDKVLRTQLDFVAKRGQRIADYCRKHGRD